MEENKETLDLGFAKLDLQREQRCGFPEVVYCAGKTVDQSVRILDILMEKYDNVIGTRADKAVYDALVGRHPAAQYDELAHMVYQHKDKNVVNGDRLISVITAGTSDIPIAEEAALTAEIMGNRVERIYDVGVAGIHRLLARVDDIRRANVNIVVAGMEGALASVVAAASSINRSSPCRPASVTVLISMVCRPFWPCSTAVLPAYPSSTSTMASAPAAWPIQNRLR